MIAIDLPTHPQKVALPRRLFTGFRVLCLAFIGVSLVLLYGRMIWLKPLPSSLAPVGHYEEIMTLAQNTKAISPTPTSLADLGKSDSAAADKLRAIYERLLPLLNEDNAVRFDPTEKAANSDRIAAVRHLARCLDAEARSAAAAKDVERAVRFAVANMRFGTMYCRNSLYLDVMIGHVAMNHGLARVIEIRKEVSPAIADSVLNELRHEAAVHDPFALIELRDQAYVEHAWGWRAVLANALEVIAPDTRPGWDTVTPIKNAVLNWQAEIELLTADFAIREFHEVEGRWPAALSEMVPQYFRTLPIDPFTGHGLLYQRTDDGFMLYSVGRDKTDNGGRFTKTTIYHRDAGYDLDLETLTRP
jgi:hypothetical protein